MAVCRRCLGTVGNLIAHRQAAAAQWTKNSCQGYIDYSYLSKVRDNPWAQQELFANIIDLPWEGDFSWRPGNILENLFYSYVKQKHSNR